MPSKIESQEVGLFLSVHDPHITVSWPLKFAHPPIIGREVGHLKHARTRPLGQHNLVLACSLTFLTLYVFDMMQ